MGDKQTDILIGISIRMEKSLSSIEKSLTGNSSSGKGNSIGGISGSVSSLIDAVSSKKFDSKKANSITDFFKNILEISNKVDPTKSKGFSDFSRGFSSTIDSIVTVMNPKNLLKLEMGQKVLFGGKNPMLKRIVDGLSTSITNIDPEKMYTASKALKPLGEGLLSLTKALKAFVGIGLVAPLVLIGGLVVKGMISLFSNIGENEKKLAKGGKALIDLGKGLISFSAGLATFALVVAVGGPLIIEAIGVIALVGLTFDILGKMKDSMKDGAQSIGLIGLGLFGFSIGLATYMLTVMSATPDIVRIGIALIGLFGLTFYTLGKLGPAMAEGSKSMGWIGLGLFGLALGLGAYAMVLEMWTPEKALLGGILLVGLGTAFAILGKMSSQIIPGVLSMEGIGLSLISISVGILAFGASIKLLQMIFGDELASAGVIAGSILVGLGTAFALLGTMSGAIIPGVASMEGVAIALASISGGILAFGIAIKLLQTIFPDDLGTAGIIAGSIIAGLGLAFGILGAGPIPVAIGLGAAAMITVGFALMSISVGILAFGIAIKLLQTIFPDDLGTAGIIAGSIIAGLGLAFGILGAGPIPVAIGLGAAAMITVGFALMSISVGILAFGISIKLLQKIFGDKLEEAGKISGAILLGLGLAFSAIGLASPLILLGSASVGLMGASLAIISVGMLIFAGASKLFINAFGGNIKDVKENVSNLFESMISSFSSAGFSILSITLGSISLGLMGASMLLFGFSLLVTATAMSKIPKVSDFIDNVFGDKGIIMSVSEAFSKIGKKYSTGLISSWLGSDPVSMGIRSVRGMGSVLSELAGGIASFANFSEFPVKNPNPKNPSKLMYGTVDIFGDIIPSLNTNLPILLSALSVSFSEIGSKYGGGDGWFSPKSPVQKGIDAIKGLGTVLSELAGGIVSFANFEAFPVQIIDEKDSSKLVYKSVNLFDIIPKIKKVLIGDGTLSGKANAKSGILFSLANIFGEIGQAYPDGFFSDSKVKQGVEATQGIGKVISELANGITAFADLERGLPVLDKDGKPTGKFTPVDIGKIQKTIKKILMTIPEVFASFDSDKFDNKKIKQLDRVADILQKFSKYGNGLNSFAESLTKTALAFEAFGSGFVKFSTNMDKFERFEGVFGRLVKKQHDYKFNEFSKSMVSLKESVNDFDVKKLGLTDSLMSSLAVISKAPDDLGKKISESLDKSFDELVKIIKEISSKQNNQNQLPVSPVSFAYQQPINNITQNNQKTQAMQLDLDELKAAIIDLSGKFDTLNQKFKIGKTGGIMVDNGSR